MGKTTRDSEILNLWNLKKSKNIVYSLLGSSGAQLHMHSAALGLV